MKLRIKIVICLFFPLSITYAQENFFSSKLSRDVLAKQLVSPGNFSPLPKAGDLVWQEVPLGIKRAYIHEAEKSLNQPWESIPATEFMEFHTSGDRMKYEFKLFDQRSRLEFAVIAELVENEGRFMNEIMNGIWKICEETWWGVPAHYKEGMLPDVDKEKPLFIDLFFSETAQMLAWVHYLMEDQLNEISPVVSKRLKEELKNRMLDPCLTTDFWWKKNTINWGTWITSNWLTTVLLLEEDRDRQLDAIEQILKTMDGFYREYPDDGGCDEGPSYWNRAAASLFESIDMLRIASDGSIDFSWDYKIQSMGSYYWKMYIGNHYFVNFADARPIIIPNVSVVYRFGKYINDDNLVRLARFIAKEQNYQSSVFPNESFVMHNDRPFLYGFGRQLFLLNQIQEVLQGDSNPPLIKHTWQENLQVFTARQFENSTDGFYFAAKGGHNDESHNHNDVGSFILYAYGQPLLIDLGVEQYTKGTFSEDRYSLWTMQSGFHNLPTINGVRQKEGKEFKAINSKPQVKKEEYTFSLDILGAYPPEANVDYWKRTMSLKSSGEFQVMEDFKLSQQIDSTFITLMVYGRVKVSANGDIILSSYDSRNYELIYDKELFTPETGFFPIEDAWLKANWENGVTRIKLILKDRNTQVKTIYRLKEIISKKQTR